MNTDLEESKATESPVQKAKKPKPPIAKVVAKTVRGTSSKATDLAPKSAKNLQNARKSLAPKNKAAEVVKKEKEVV